MLAFFLPYIYWIFSAKGAGSDELSSKDETTKQYLKVIKRNSLLVLLSKS